MYLELRMDWGKICARLLTWVKILSWTCEEPKVSIYKCISLQDLPVDIKNAEFRVEMKKL